MAVPATLRRLLSREEVATAALLFDSLAVLPSRDSLGIDAVSQLADLSASPNLATLLDERNTSFIAYLRFAPLPWRFREFMRMLCPSADERELAAFDEWREDAARERSRRQDLDRGLGRRPASRSGSAALLPSLPRGSKDLPSLRKQHKDRRLTPRTSCPELGQVGTLRGARSASPGTDPRTAEVPLKRWSPREGPPRSGDVRPPVCPPASAAAVRMASPAARAPATPEPQSKALPDGPVARAAADQIKRYVQQRYLELMMVDGMDPNAACARALREAPERLEAARTACT